MNADDAALAEKATALVDGIEAVIRPWLVRLVVERAGEASRPRAEAMADATAAEVLPQVRALLLADIDDQATTPMALLRTAVLPADALLTELGVAPVDRDEFAERAFPADVHGLAPAAFEDVDPSLRDPGIEWGAAKAYVHLRRRQAPGGPGTAP